MLKTQLHFLWIRLAQRQKILGHLFQKMCVATRRRFKKKKIHRLHIFLWLFSFHLWPCLFCHITLSREKKKKKKRAFFVGCEARLTHLHPRGFPGSHGTCCLLQHTNTLDQWCTNATETLQHRYTSSTTIIVWTQTLSVQSFISLQLGKSEVRRSISYHHHTFT